MLGGSGIKIISLEREEGEKKVRWKRKTGRRSESLSTGAGSGEEKGKGMGVNKTAKVFWVLGGGFSQWSE